MKGIEIVELTKSMETAYEEFLRDCDQALLYYSVRYKGFLCDLLGCRASYWLAVRDSKIVGALPMMAREGPYGTVWNSLPYFGSYGGVIAKDPDAVAALYRHYNSTTSADDVAAATIVSNPLVTTDESLIAFDVVDKRVGQFVFLDDPAASSLPDQLLAAIAGSARRNIRKAQQCGVKVRVENGAMDFVEVCHRENMAAIGGRAKSPRFFDLVPTHFGAGTDYNIYVAEIDGVTAAALLLFYYNNTVEYFTPVISAQHRSYQPMALIVYTAMLEAARLGCVRWNWGGTWLSQEGLYRFKKKWNTVDVPYKYYTRINNRTLLRLEKAEIANAYADFYVLPFDALGT